MTIRAAIVIVIDESMESFYVIKIEKKTTLGPLIESKVADFVRPPLRYHF